jgi:hypothetical protein
VLAGVYESLHDVEATPCRRVPAETDHPAEPPGPQVRWKAAAREPRLPQNLLGTSPNNGMHLESVLSPFHHANQRKGKHVFALAFLISSFGATREILILLGHSLDM